MFHTNKSGRFSWIAIGAFFLLGSLFSVTLFGQEEGKQMTMAQAVDHALEQSKLT